MFWGILFSVLLIVCVFLYWRCKPAFDLIKRKNKMGILEKHIIFWYSNVITKKRHYIRIKV
jgi:hypothetical protein